MAERTLIDRLKTHFANGEIPQTPERTKFMLTLGLVENYLAQPTGRRKDYLDDLKNTLVNFGLSEVPDTVPQEYNHMRFLYERRMTIEESPVLGIPMESTGALILLGRGYDISGPAFHTMYGATIYNRESQPDATEAFRFTTAFLPFSHYYDKHDPHMAAEIPLFPVRRETISGTIIPKGETFSVTLNPDKTSQYGADGLRALMRKTAPGRRTKHAIEPRDMPPENVAYEWLKHFVVHSSTGESTYYSHFPRSTRPLIALI